MSGHSKWSNIKRKKEGADARRAKIFTKIGREIAVAAREGGANPEANSRLRDIIAKARANNVPNDNIQRMLAKLRGEDGAVYESIPYEGYGPGGVAVIVETMTDNKNRTVGDVRHYFDKYGGNLGATGCVSWMFDRRGVLVIEKVGEDGTVRDEDALMLRALDIGALDVDAGDEAFEVTTQPEDFSRVREALEADGYTFLSAEIEMVPQNYTALSDPDAVRNMEKLLELLEDNDDVQNIWHNWEE